MEIYTPGDADSETLLQAYVGASLEAYYKHPSHIRIVLGSHGQYLNGVLSIPNSLFQCYEGVPISPYPNQEGNKLQRTTLGFIRHTPHED